MCGGVCVRERDKEREGEGRIGRAHHALTVRAA